MSELWRLIKRFRFRRSEPERYGSEWAVRHGWPDKNPVHEHFWPECRKPLPHGHSLGVLDEAVRKR